MTALEGFAYNLHVSKHQTYCRILPYNFSSKIW